MGDKQVRDINLGEKQMGVKCLGEGRKKNLGDKQVRDKNLGNKQKGDKCDVSIQEIKRKITKWDFIARREGRVNFLGTFVQKNGLQALFAFLSYLHTFAADNKHNTDTHIN